MCLHCDCAPNFYDSILRELELSLDFFCSEVSEKVGTTDDIAWRDPIMVTTQTWTTTHDAHHYGYYLMDCRSLVPVKESAPAIPNNGQVGNDEPTLNLNCWMARGS